MKRTQYITPSRAIFWLFVALAAWFLAHRFGQIQTATNTLLAGSLLWIIVAAILQAIYYYCLTMLSILSFKIVGIKRTVSGLLPLILGSLVINVLAPSGGAAGAGLFMQDASARKESVAKTGSAALLALLGTYFSFIPILAAGVIFLISQHEIRVYQIAGSLVLILLIGAIYLAFRLATQRKSVLRHLFHGVDRVASAINWTLRRTKPILKKGWIDEVMAELAEAGEAVHSRPKLVQKALQFGLLGYLINILSLAAIFLAFHQQLNVGIIIAGYAISFLFWIVAPAPQGIGIEEAIMSLVLGSLGLPAAQSIAIAVAFRGVNFWLPMLVGIVLYARHQHQSTTLQNEYNPNN